MPPRAIVQVGLERLGALPEDVSTNTWHFEGDDPATFDSLLPGLVDRVRVFYQAIGSRLSSALSGNFTIKVYDWSDPLPRVPKSQTTYVLTKGTAMMPSEVALCLSYKGAVSSGAVAARRRGRVFLGPLSTGAGTGGTSDFRPIETAATQILDAAKVMATGSGGAFRLAIYSPTTKAQGGSDDASWNDATSFWIDNAFDTIRSRGASPTLRWPATINP
jgi:hypothetical protein